MFIAVEISVCPLMGAVALAKSERGGPATVLASLKVEKEKRMGEKAKSKQAKRPYASR